jgi:hypothetical protein
VITGFSIVGVVWGKSKSIWEEEATAKKAKPERDEPNLKRP